MESVESVEHSIVKVLASKSGGACQIQHSVNQNDGNFISRSLKINK